MAGSKWDGFGAQLQKLFYAAILLAVGYGLITGFHSMFWGEETGDVKYEDCRDKITVEESSGSTLFKKFTCTYVKTQSGKILRGTCVHVETEGPVCQTALIYEKNQRFTAQ